MIYKDLKYIIKWCGLLLILSLSGVSSCSAQKADEEKKQPNHSKFDFSKAYQVFKTRCGACHSLNPPSPNGPPLYGIAGHYYRANKDSSQFIQEFMGFVSSPDSQRALMPEQVKIHGVMPELEVPPEDLQLIAQMSWLLMHDSDQVGTGLKPLKTKESELGKGGVVFLEKCGACHTLNPPPLNGPPARGIFMHYRMELGSYEKFKDYFIKFVLNPSETDPILTHAVNEFGPMPNLKVNKEELKIIAEWMWNYFYKTGRMGGHRGNMGHMNHNMNQMHDGGR